MTLSIASQQSNTCTEAARLEFDHHRSNCIAELSTLRVPTRRATSSKGFRASVTPVCSVFEVPILAWMRLIPCAIQLDSTGTGLCPPKVLINLYLNLPPAPTFRPNPPIKTPEQCLLGDPRTSVLSAWSATQIEDVRASGRM